MGSNLSFNLRLNPVLDSRFLKVKLNKEFRKPPLGLCSTIFDSQVKNGGEPLLDSHLKKTFKCPNFETNRTLLFFLTTL